MKTTFTRNTTIDFEEMDRTIIGEDDLLFRNADRYYYESDIKKFKNSRIFSIKKQLPTFIIGLILLIVLTTLYILGNYVEALIIFKLTYQIPTLIAISGLGLFIFINLIKLLYALLEKNKKPMKSIFNAYNSTFDLVIDSKGKKSLVFGRTYTWLYYLIKVLGYISAILVIGGMVFAFVLMLIDSDNISVGHILFDIFFGAASITVIILGTNLDYYFYYYNIYVLTLNKTSYMFKDNKFERIE